MNIGKASKLSDLTVKATRYYANIDLVKPRKNKKKKKEEGKKKRKKEG